MIKSIVVLSLSIVVACSPAPAATPLSVPTRLPTTTSTLPATLALTATPRATETSMPAATATAAVMPTMTPTPDYSAAVLTTYDLPSGFQPATPADMVRLNISEATVAKGFGSLTDGRPRNLQVFLRAAPSYEQVMTALMYPLSPSDAALIDSAITHPDGLVKTVGAGVTSGGNGVIQSATPISGTDRFGDHSIGVSLVSSGRTVPLRWDVLLARRSSFAELIYLVYLDGRQPSITVSDLARILDARVAATLPTETLTQDGCAGATAVGARQRYTLEQIVPCLKTVAQVGEFMQNNVKYDVEYDIREHGAIEYEPAALVYERGIDDANGYAILECYLLERNGWDAFVIGLSIETPTGSNVCGVNIDGRILVLQGAGQMIGPFISFTDLATHYAEMNWMKPGGTVKSLRASQVTQITTDHTSPDILGLPWVSHSH